jgi:hypothetical protein
VSIAPIVRSVIVKGEPARAFELFTRQIQDWWPKSKTIGREPPHRLPLAWQIGADWAYHPDLLTELELSFKAQTPGGTIVTLEHRRLERLGSDAARVREMLDGGWPTLLCEFQMITGDN